MNKQNPPALEGRDAAGEGVPPVVHRTTETDRNTEKNRIGALVIAVLSLIVFLSQSDTLGRTGCLGGGIVILLRAFRSPLSLKGGLVSWFGGAFVAIAVLVDWMVASSIAHGTFSFGMGFQEAVVANILGSLAALFLLREFKHSAIIETGTAGEEEYMGPRCVSCRAPIQPSVKICPKCGWTQP
jgi:hypothetical protein